MLKRLLRRLRGPVLRPVIEVPKATLGTEYGGQTVSTLDLRPGAIVYSFGVGEDVSFDLELIRAFGCEVYAFDPTPRSVAFVASQVRDEHFHFTAIGIAASDGTVTVGKPENPNHVSHYKPAKGPIGDSGRWTQFEVKRYDTIRRELGHARVDLLKLDIEGFEFEVIPDLARADVLPAQVLVDFHHGMYGYREADTSRAVKALGMAGYALFHVAENGHGSFISRNAVVARGPRA